MKIENEELAGPNPDDMDDEALLDHCAMECMNAIEKKDKQAFLESLNVLVADLLHRMSSDESMEDDHADGP